MDYGFLALDVSSLKLILCPYLVLIEPRDTAPKDTHGVWLRTLSPSTLLHRECYTIGMHELTPKSHNLCIVQLFQKKIKKLDQ
jgi:hypothetical protein